MSHVPKTLRPLWIRRARARLPQTLRFVLEALQRVEFALLLELGATAFGEVLVGFLGDRVRILARHGAGAREHAALVEAQELVESLAPVAQEDLLAPARLVLGEVEEQDEIRLSSSISSGRREFLATVTSLLRTAPPFHVVSPMFGRSAFARSAINSGAVLPVAAKWSLFWTTWKNAWVSLSFDE